MHFGFVSDQCKTIKLKNYQTDPKPAQILFAGFAPFLPAIPAEIQSPGGVIQHLWDSNNPSFTDLNPQFSSALWEEPLWILNDFPVSLWLQLTALSYLFKSFVLSNQWWAQLSALCCTCIFVIMLHRKHLYALIVDRTSHQLYKQRPVYWPYLNKHCNWVLLCKCSRLRDVDQSVPSGGRGGSSLTDSFCIPPLAVGSHPHPQFP